jgi:hypothetical protein
MELNHQVMRPLFAGCIAMGIPNFGSTSAAEAALGGGSYQTTSAMINGRPHGLFTITKLRASSTYQNRMAIHVRQFGISAVLGPHILPQ